MTAPARGWQALVIVLSLLPPFAATLGCVPPVKESQLERGQTLTTGNEPYDAFFQAVRATREEALKSESDAANARVSAARKLGLKDEATPGDAIAAVRARAAMLREAGVSLHLELTPEAKLVTPRGKARIGAEDRSVLDVLEEAARSSIAASLRFDELGGRAAELEKQRVALEAESQTVFAGAPSARREEIQREIEAAHRVLADVTQFCSDRSGLASKFALDLALALETGTGARGGAGSPAASARRGPPNGGQPATAPTPPPSTPKPSGEDDFDP